MAEVLSPPMSSSTISILHTRPQSADAFQGSQSYHQPLRLNQAPRSMYNGPNHGYRTSSSPVQPYAFQSTPTLRPDSRTKSTPNLPNGQIANHRATASTSTSSSDASMQPTTKIDTATSSSAAPVLDMQLPDLSFTPFDTTVKASPDRYRRPPPQKRSDSMASGSAARTPSPAMSDASLEPPSIRQIQRQSSLDDMSVKTGSAELAKRYRRRSLNSADTLAAAGAPPGQATTGAQQTSAMTQTYSAALSSNGLNSSQGESKQQVEGATSANTVHIGRENDRPSEVGRQNVSSITSKVTPPPRGSSDSAKRLAAPSPLSRQANEVEAATTTPAPIKTYAAAAQSAVPTLSPAAQQLAAVSDKDLNKGMKSRLRRAFSFGSAQELRRTAGENNQQRAMQAKEQHGQQIDDELDAEQMEIARRQEAAGIGAGIYSGQGGFTGSTDNLSISSTASSASVMLRKMGKGAKKGARSIKGLFRPKSVIGVPAADGPVQVGSAAPVEPSVGQVSMVTVEAERQIVNVNARPDERTGGGTGFPKLERNSLDAGTTTAAVENRPSADTTSSDANSRRSIVGGDRDRAEVLAAVRKGILKRSATASPHSSPTIRPNENGLPQVPHITESPSSSLPGTPKEGAFHRSSSAPAVNDYFAARMGVGRSMPNTPNGSVRSISFSPKISFHDAWSATDYDRRGEVATCNRLTPLLAQQIKEELNTFKMEMEVHELSKPHTHFF